MSNFSLINWIIIILFVLVGTTPARWFI